MERVMKENFSMREREREKEREREREREKERNIIRKYHVTRHVEDSYQM